MLGPMMNSTLIWVFLLPSDVRPFRPIIKSLCWNMCNVPESIPLSPGLRVELVFVIVCNVLPQCLDFVLELLSIKCWYGRNIQGQIQGDNISGPDLLRGGSNSSRREEVNSSYLTSVRLEL